MSGQFLFFDLDGTLVDSSTGIYAAFKQAVLLIGKVPPTYKVFLQKIGPPIRFMILHFYPEISSSDLNIAVKCFRHNYDNINYSQFKLYDGVLELIKSISLKSRFRMAVVTNKPTHPSRMILKESSLLELFEIVVGIDYLVYNQSGTVFYDKEASLRFCLDYLRADPSLSFYIGDTNSDKAASEALSIPFIAATYGFYSWPLSSICSTSIRTISELSFLLDIQ